jgi:hypothetical protein
LDVIAAPGPFAPDQIKKFEARSAIGKKRKSPKR